MNLHPFHECVVQAMNILALTPGAVIHQQFLCASCNTKQTMETPNKFFKTGKCEECGFITNIEQAGCNYLLMVSSKGG